MTLKSVEDQDRTVTFSVNMSVRERNEIDAIARKYRMNRSTLFRQVVALGIAEYERRQKLLTAMAG